MKFVFDWDESKANINLAKHKVSFDEGKTIFNDPFLITLPDEAHSDKEERFISIGTSTNERVLLVVHLEKYTSPENILIRIISCRKATSIEENYMKKVNNISEDYNDGMMPEYDFSSKKGVRGKYYRSMREGYTVRIHNEDGTVTEQRFGPLENTVKLDPDVIVYFPDSESVNKALRTLISIIPDKQVGEKPEKYTVSKKPAKKNAAKK